MKKQLLALVAVCSFSAFANDGGVTGIVVQDLEVSKGSISGENLGPIGPDQGVEASFSGENVRELMKLLPGDRSAGFEEYGKHFKSLTFAARGGYVSIHCGDAQFDYTNETYAPVTPNCTVSVYKYADLVSEDLVTDLFGDFNELSVPNSCEMN